MTLDQALAELEALGSERVRAQNVSWGASDNQYGVKLGDIRKVAKAIKSNHDLALELWQTGNHDARFLAILLLKPKKLTADQLDHMVRSVTFTRVSDWLNAYVIKKHPAKDTLRQTWLTTDHPMAARAGWEQTALVIAKTPEAIDSAALLDRIEADMADADPIVQWTMNHCLAEIGIHLAEHRERAIAVGEALGVFRDYPVSKGCTSPFAPIWIEEMVSRQG
ncbi:MAG: DNA alkylation repair protein [Acidobacteriota bacterium]